MIVLIMQLSGASPSAFQVPYNSFKKKSESSGADMSDGHSNGDLQEKDSKDLDYDFVCFFLSTQRLDLYRSIDFRCEDMLLGKREVLAYGSVKDWSSPQELTLVSCIFLC